MTASHRPYIAKKKLRVKSSTLYRIIKKIYSIKKPPLFLSIKKIESYKNISFLFIKRNKKEIIIKLKKEEKEINLSYLIRTLGSLIKFFKNKKEGKKHIYLKLDINKLFQFLKIKVNGNIRTKSNYLYSKNDSKKCTNNKQPKKSNNPNIEDKNDTLSIKDSTTSSFSKTSKPINFAFSRRHYNFAFSRRHYCNYYPKRGEMKERVGKVPYFFPIQCFHGINQRQNEIGNKLYLSLKDDNIFNSNNDSYKSIDKKNHLLLNHICQKNVDIKIINSFTFRYRNKNSTFVYYN